MVTKVAALARSDDHPPMTLDPNAGRGGCPQPPPSTRANRKSIDHRPPPAFRKSWFFLTICCEPRGLNQLCQPATSTAVLTDAVYYHHQLRWSLHILLLMPDHLHLIVSFPKNESMSAVVRDWKRLTAKRAGIQWQRNYFDHRVRPDDGLHQKTDYIRMNPIRAGLVSSAEDWPHVVDYNALAGR